MAANFLSVFVLVFLPVFAGLLIVAPFFPDNAVKIRRYAKGFGIFQLIYSICFLLFLNPKDSTFGFISKLPFDIMPNAAISFGFDNLSALMCVFTAFVMLMAFVISKSMITSKQKLFYSMMLLLQGFLTGIFAANDLFTFFSFWILEIIPAYFLISMWGGTNAKKSALRYVICAFSGAILMFVAICLIYAFAADSNMLTDFDSIINRTIEIPLFMQLLVAAGFLAAFMVKMPVFPFHTWIADAHTEAPTPACMVLAGVAIKTAVYGIIRINIQMFYEIFQIMAPSLIFLGAIGALWGTYLAISQNDIKKMLSYSTISHMGVILIGVASFTEYGINGAIFHSIAHGLIIAGLFAGTGIIYMKFKTRKLELLGGIIKYSPLLCGFMTILCLSYAAMPFTSGFFGEALCFIGGFNSPLIEKSFFLSSLIQPVVLFSIFSILLCGVCTLRLLHRTFFGLLEYKFDENIKLSHHQIAVLSILAAGIIIFGIYPAGILDKINLFSTTNMEVISKSIF